MKQYFEYEKNDILDIMDKRYRVNNMILPGYPMMIYDHVFIYNMKMLINEMCTQQTVTNNIITKIKVPPYGYILDSWITVIQKGGIWQIGLFLNKNQFKVGL